MTPTKTGPCGDAHEDGAVPAALLSDPPAEPAGSGEGR